MDLRSQLCRSDGGLGRKKGCGSATQAVAAARRSVVVPMLVIRRGCSGVVDVLFRTGIQVSGNQMQRGVSIAVGKRQRQQQDQASDKQRSHKSRRPRSSRDLALVHSITLGHMRGMPESDSSSVRSSCANQLDEIIDNVAAFLDLQSGRWNMRLGLAVKARSIGERYPGIADPQPYASRH